MKAEAIAGRIKRLQLIAEDAEKDIKELNEVVAAFCGYQNAMIKALALFVRDLYKELEAKDE